MDNFDAKVWYKDGEFVFIMILIMMCVVGFAYVFKEDTPKAEHTGETTPDPKAGELWSFTTGENPFLPVIIHSANVLETKQNWVKFKGSDNVINYMSFEQFKNIYKENK